MSTSIKPVLTYFQIRGKAEPIRLLLEECGVEYGDVRIGRSEWYGGKKQEYSEKGWSPFGQMPLIEIGGQHYAQMLSIMRYFAEKHKLYAETLEDRLRCDMIAQGAEDWREDYSNVVYSSNFDQANPKYIAETLPKYTKVFDNLLKQRENGDVFFVGKQLTYCDFVVYEMLDINLRLDSQCLSAYSKLSAFHKRIAERPAIAKYTASGRRPENVNNSGKG